MSQYNYLIGKTPIAIREMAGATTFPFNASEIVRELGIKVDRHPHLKMLPYAGSITKHDDGTIFIWVNSGDSQTRQNFTIAHELGHLVNGDLEEREREFRDNTNTLYRSSAENKKEWKANEFAAELIMPEVNVREELGKLLKKDKNIAVGVGISILAEKFDVSKAAMRVRLKFLGIIK